MQKKRSARRKHKTVKLSVTVKGRLEHKYNHDPAALRKIKTAIERWKKADADRGICTVHVEVDDSEVMLKVWRDYFPKAPRIRPVSGKATAPKIKRAIDDLWKRLKPEYLVLFGGHDIVPMFEVDNPSNFLGWPTVDWDRKLATDNPYASSKVFRPLEVNSYLVPDRVIGRIPDMMSSDDPAWLVDYLATATGWKSKSPNFYRETYAMCSSEMIGAGRETMKYISKPASDLLICPRTRDTSPSARNRLSARLHLIRCHGNRLDASFWGNKGKRFVRAITSATLKARLQPDTLVGTMCCYGAQIFSPDASHARSHRRWPLASTYLRKGALAFVGSTRMAWLGQDVMKSADWIVADYLKRILENASIGRAFLESKQKYVSHYTAKGRAVDAKGQKTLIEYVLLGDPSIHPVGRTVSDPESRLAAEERRQRRVVLARRSEQVCKLLPMRTRATPAPRAMAKKLFKDARRSLWKDDINELKKFRIKPSEAQVVKLHTPLHIKGEARGGRGVIRSRQSLEYYWGGQRLRDRHTQICLITAETDLNHKVWRTSVSYSSYVNGSIVR